MKPEKYPSQATYAKAKAADGCVRVTMWVHKNHVEALKRYARQNQVA